MENNYLYPSTALRDGKLSKEDGTTFCLICHGSIKTDFLMITYNAFELNPAACKNCLKEFDSSEDVKKALS